MATISAITRISARDVAIALIGFALVLFAYVNVFSTPTPLADWNAAIADELVHSGNLPATDRAPVLAALRQQQEDVLTRKAAEPFAWARLAWLRIATGQGDSAAFAALRFSDLVSPNEPRQLPERAMMWRQLRAAENADQQAYQTVLWQKAYDMQHDETWNIALRNGVTAEVGDALQQTDPEAYEEWKARMAEMATPPVPAPAQ